MIAGKSALFVGTFLSSSRGHRSVGEDLAQKLEQRGWRTILTSSQTSRWLRPVAMTATAWRRRHDYAVAHVDVYSGFAFMWAELTCAVLRRLGKPIVLTLRGGNLPTFAGRHSRRVGRLLRSADAVTTPSDYLREQMRSYREDMTLIPNPLEIERYPLRPRAQVGPRLVWLRSLHAIYNPTLAVRVLALLAPEFPEVHLTMVGPDKGDGSYEQVVRLAQELGVRDRLTLTGGVPKADVSRCLHEGDIFLNTTNIDNTPVSVTEAMACGLCVVSTNVGGIPYLLKEDVDALLVPPDDAEAMAASVRRLLLEPALAEHLAQNARAKTESFDWADILPRWESLLSRFVEVV